LPDKGFLELSTGFPRYCGKNSNEADDMTQIPELGDVTYNAASQSFEALATCDTQTGQIRLPASFEAPLDAPEQLVRQGLVADATRKMQNGSELRSRVAHPMGDGSDESDVASLFSSAKRFIGNAWNKAA
jgi:hypothetical protein